MEHLWTPWRMPYLRGEEGHSNGCLFCIASQMEDSEVHIVYRGDLCYVILNRFPYNNGHLMIVPYDHTPTLETLEPQVLTSMMSLVQRSLRVLRQAYDPQGFNVGANIGAAAGAGVADHVHLHVVPRWAGDNNYISVIGETRVIPEWLDQTYGQLKPLFEVE